MAMQIEKMQSVARVRMLAQKQMPDFVSEYGSQQRGDGDVAILIVDALHTIEKDVGVCASRSGDERHAKHRVT